MSSDTLLLLSVLLAVVVVAVLAVAPKATGALARATEPMLSCAARTTL